MRKPQQAIAVMVLATFTLQAMAYSHGMVCRNAAHVAQVSRTAVDTAEAAGCDHRQLHGVAAPSADRREGSLRAAIGECGHGCQDDCSQPCHPPAGGLVELTCMTAQGAAGGLTIFPSGAVLPPYCDLPLRPPAASRA